MQDVKLLIVDDDEDDFLLARDLLDEITRGPYTLDWASSYEEGEAQLRRNHHDLCLMDYRLGADDGIELLKRAQEIGYTGPIILLTGMHEGEVDIQALEAGAVDYLVKANLTAEQLARSIRYAVARREMERERVERMKAEAENRSKSEFLAHLSHELRTPLSAILGFTELLINKNKDAETLSHLRVVDRNGKHLLGLLNDILDLSKIEAGKLELEMQRVELTAFLADIYELMYGSAIDKNLNIRLEALNDLPQSITTDPTRLRQVLLNLLGNAIKFTDQGEIVLTVGLGENNGRDVLCFGVRDTGIGISPESCEAIFQPFVQSRDRLAQPRAGTGLGLTISQQLVERLGGEIVVSSQLGKGSHFKFTISPGDIEGVKRIPFNLDFPTEHTSSASIPKFNGRVLVVDDLRDIRLLIGHFVEATGLEVVCAKNGREALRIVAAETSRNKEFDVVLMDIHMPVMGGLEAARLLRESGFSKPLVALTAAHMKGDMDTYLMNGFTAYLSKPVDQHHLYSCLARFISASPAEVELTESGSWPAADISNRTVLVVEDDADALQATAGLLGLLGWIVISAADAAEAIAAAQKHNPAVVLVDLNLPDMSGYGVATQIKKVLPQVKIVIASGEEIDSQKAKDAGVSAGLLKPLSLDQLKSALAQ